MKAVGGENIAGTLSVTLEGDKPVIGNFSDGSDEITLNVDELGTYYIAIAPGIRFEKGILATYYKGSLEAGSYFLDGNFTIERAVIARVGALEERIGNYYVSQNGANAKTGANPENAMSPAGLRTLLDSVDAAKIPAQAATLDGAVIHLAEGTYDMEDLVTLRDASHSRIAQTQIIFLFRLHWYRICANFLPSPKASHPIFAFVNEKD